MTKLLILLLSLIGLPALAANELYLAVASDMSYCMDELGAAFSKQVPQARLRVSVGASGNFYAQIKHGAPFDLFLSADMTYPSRLAADGAADRASLAPYALGRLAIWSLDARFELTQGMRVFADQRLTRIAIANPDVAPYGHAAKAALVLYGLWDSVKPKLVLGENIAQTAQFVQTGNAELGIVSLATVLAPRLKGIGQYYLIPEAGMPPIEHGMIVTSKGRANWLAARFARFMRSEAARDILVRYGFGLPPPPGAPGND